MHRGITVIHSSAAWWRRCRIGNPVHAAFIKGVGDSGLSFFYHDFLAILLILFCLSLFSFPFFYCLVFLFCALTSGPPGVSPVTASSLAGRPASLSYVVAAASSPSFGFSPLAIVLWGGSPLGVVSLGSCCAGASRHFVLLHVLIITP